MIDDYSLIAVALFLQSHDELEKTRRNTREHLAFVNSMSGASRSFGILINTVFPSNPNAWIISEFCQQLARECEKDKNKT